MSFTFNNNYEDLEQVSEFLPAFSEVYAQEVAAGRYTYNDSFKGRIAAIAGPCEDTAIYLLQGLYRQRETNERVRQALADGFEMIESVERVEKFARVIFYDPDRGSGWQEWEIARLVPETNLRQSKTTGAIRGVLPKGQRTNGFSAMGKRILVKR